ncbi:MAG: hypothetical protein V1682_07160 [Candidatus Omnitrophota bacterium]
MADEKKEETTKAPEAPKEAEAPAQGAAATSPAPAAENAASAPAPAKDEKKEDAPAKREKPANCAGCKKSIKNKRWYYRNGKYYCTKRCWSATNKKPAKTEDTPNKA